MAMAMALHVHPAAHEFLNDEAMGKTETHEFFQSSMNQRKDDTQ